MKILHTLRSIWIVFGIVITGVVLCFPSFAAQNTSYRDVDTTVSSLAREKYTRKKGGGRDQVTIMIYMIGSNLESENGMATADLNELLYARPDNPNINLFVQTGGCKRWRNSVMTAGKIERWKIDSSGMSLQEQLQGQAMTDPNALSSFIRYCAEEAPAEAAPVMAVPAGTQMTFGGGVVKLYIAEGKDIAIEFPV